MKKPTSKMFTFKKYNNTSFSQIQVHSAIITWSKILKKVLLCSVLQKVDIGRNLNGLESFFSLLRWDRSKLSRDEEEELAKVFTR
jgi:hypothetical protein